MTVEEEFNALALAMPVGRIVDYKPDDDTPPIRTAVRSEPYIDAHSNKLLIYVETVGDPVRSDRCTPVDEPDQLNEETGYAPVLRRHNFSLHETCDTANICMQPEQCPNAVSGTCKCYGDGILDEDESMRSNEESVPSTDEGRIKNNVMRHEYRLLDEDERQQMKDLKDMGLAFIERCDQIGSSREMDEAKTKMEEAVMWGVKHITRD